MAIKSNLNSEDIGRELQAQAEALFNKILNSFIRAGLKFITAAREQAQDHSLGTYLDDTTNLRNSIQFLVFYNGKEVHASDSEFTNQNRGIVKDFVNAQGFQIFLIAGMNYASWVESKGYNVISFQADQCMVDLTLYLEDLEQIEKGSAAGLEESFIPGDLPENFVVK